MSLARPLEFPFPPRDFRHEAIALLADDRRLLRLGRRIAAITAALLVLFTAYYAYDRYFVTVESPLDKAVSALEAKVRQNPGDLDLRMQVAGVYAQQERYDQAIAQYQQVLNVRKDWSPALEAMAAIEAARGNDARAEELYRQVAESAKSSDLRYATKDLQLVYYRLAAYAAKAGRHAEAVDWARETLKVDATDADALYLLGQEEEARGNLAPALDAYRGATSFDPRYQQAFAGIERVAGALGDVSTAAYARGMQQLAGGDANAALATFQRLVADAPDFAPAYEGLGLAYAKQSDRDDAVAAFRAALDRDPRLLLAQWSLRTLGAER